jgi:DnaJ-class molecular chaperone
MNINDCYRILGVAPGASEDEIRVAYRKLAVVYHPDKNPGNPAAEQKFREIAEAYAMIRGNGAVEVGYDVRAIFHDLFSDLLDGLLKWTA